MRLVPVALALTFVVASQATAQRGLFAVYPDDGLYSTSFIDRGVMNTNGNAGEILNELPAGMAAGVGQRGGGVCSIAAMVCVLQDQNAATTSAFRVVARPRNASGTGPDRTQAIFNVGPLNTPVATGVQAWFFTVTFTTAVQVPCDGGYFYGISLPAVTGWPATDGLSAHMADYTAGTRGDHPRSGAPNLGWSNDLTAATVVSHPYVWAVGMLASGPTIQVGAIDPANTRTNPLAAQGTTTFGAGGFYPDVRATPRSDGLEVRFYDEGAPGASTGILFAFRAATAPISIPGVLGELRLDPATLFGFNGVPIATTAPERGIAPFLPAGSLPVALATNGSRVFFQGVVLDPGAGLWLTNSVGVQF